MSGSDNTLQAAPSLLPLTALTQHDRRSAGGKAIGLASLAEAGLRIPPGFVIPSGFYSAFPIQLDIDLPSIAEAVKSLGPELIVRSSANIEDGGSWSFAGIFETAHTVCSPGELDMAVRHVLQSASSPTAMSYLRRSESTTSTIEMAVIIQQQVRVAWTGTVFTRNPLDVFSNEMVLEIYDCRSSGAEKQPLFSLRFDREEHSLEAEQLCSFNSLPRSILTAIVRDALKYEKSAGSPQDIEWGIDESGQHWFFQARPITTSLEENISASEIYASFNLRENFADPPTPLTWSIFQEQIVPTVFRTVARVNTSTSTNGIQVLVGGRPYWRLSPFLYNPLLRPIALSAIEHLDTSAGKAIRNALSDRHNMPRKRHRPPTYLLPFRIASLTCFFILQSPGRLEQERHRFAMSLPEQLANEISFEHACCALRSWIGSHRKAFSTLFALGVVYYLTSILVRRWTGANAGQLLLFALSGAKSGATDRALALDKACEDCCSGEMTEAQSSFLSQFGHRCPSECELMTPRWSDCPTDFRNYLSETTRSVIYPAEMQAAVLSQRLRAREALRANLELQPLGKLRWKVVSRLLACIESLLAWREDVKDVLMRHFAILRSRAVTLGRAAKTAHICSREDDIFFLNVQEMITLERALNNPDLQSGQLMDLERLVQARRIQMALAKRKPPFDLIVSGRGGFNFEQVQSSLPRLVGEIACPGIITGRACIVTAGNLKFARPGTILVLEHVDAGCLPWIVQAYGLIIERAGVLSHAAVIAREFGIPCLVGVNNATVKIQNDDLVTLNASRGNIILHLGPEIKV